MPNGALRLKTALKFASPVAGSGGYKVPASRNCWSLGDPGSEGAVSQGLRFFGPEPGSRVGPDCSASLPSIGGGAVMTGP